MTVYVDDMNADFKIGTYSMKMSHMIATTDEELHRMADSIGVDRKWFQADHYDISLSKKKLALQNGAIQVTWRQLGALVILKRLGLEIGDPATAYKRAKIAKTERHSSASITIADTDAEDAAADGDMPAIQGLIV